MSERDTSPVGSLDIQYVAHRREKFQNTRNVHSSVCPLVQTLSRTRGSVWNLIFGVVVWYVETLEFWLKSDKNKGILYSKAYMRVSPDLERVMIRAKVVKNGCPNFWWQRAKPVTVGWGQCGKI